MKIKEDLPFVSNSLVSFVPFVKKQADRVVRIVQKHPEDSNAATNLKPFIERFDKLLTALIEHQNELERLQNENVELKSQTSDLRKIVHGRRDALSSLDLRPEDIAGLPKEVLDQLSLNEGDFQDFQILQIIRDAGGILSLDKLIIAHFRNTGQVLERVKLNARLYRMTTKGLLWAHPSSRGVYTSFPPEDDGKPMEEETPI